MDCKNAHRRDRLIWISARSISVDLRLRAIFFSFVRFLRPLASAPINGEDLSAWMHDSAHVTFPSGVSALLRGTLRIYPKLAARLLCRSLRSARRIVVTGAAASHRYGRLPPFLAR